METGRLLKVVEDIQADESSLGIQGRFENILNFFNQNNPDQLNQERQALVDAMSSSRLRNYVLTDYKILESLKINKFFGEDSLSTLDSILAGRAHEVGRELTAFVQSRKEAISKLEASRNALSAFGMKARVLPQGEYEIAFALPKDYQTVQKVEKFLTDARLLLSQIADNGNVNGEFKINYVNNGSIQFYIQAAQTLAEHFDILLDYAIKIYAGIEMVSKIKGQVDKFAAKRKGEVSKLMEAEQKEQAESYEEEMFVQLDIKTEEKKTAVRMTFRRFLKHIENGVAAEVRTPHLQPPPDPTETDDKAKKTELAQQKKVYLANEAINNRNKEIYILQKGGFDGISIGNFLPSSEKDNEEEQKKQDK